MSSATGFGVIGKSSPWDDFAVLVHPEGSNSAVESRVREFLQMHIESRSPQSTFLFFHSSKWWISVAENLNGSDVAGRPLCQAKFSSLMGQAAEPPLHYLETAIPLAEDGINLRSPAPPVSTAPCATPAARRALLELLLTDEVALVPTVCEAAWVARRWSACADIVFVRTSGYITTHERLGKIIAVSPIERSLTKAVREALDLIEDGEIPAIERLRAIPTTTARQRLISIWRRGFPQSLQDLSFAEKTWLLAANVYRDELLTSASAEERRKWLADGMLRFGEVERHAASWKPDDRIALASVLRGCPGGLRLFMQCVKPDSAQVLDFLEPELKQTYLWVKQGCNLPGPDGAAESVGDFHRAGALDCLSLAELSRSFGSFPIPPLEKAWIDALTHAGLPAEVAAALSGDFPLTIAPRKPPSLPPDSSWLAPINGERLLAAGRWACADGAWRRWWVQALRAHPKANRSVPSVENFAGPVSWLWLAGEVRDGVLALPTALDAVAKWLAANPAPIPSPEEVQTVLAAGRISAPDFWASVITRRQLPSGRTPDATDISTIALLVAHKLLDLSDIVSSILAGAADAWLNAFVSSSVAALLRWDSGSLPPAPLGPPAGWQAVLIPLLARAVQHREFWSKWRETGVRFDLVEWMCGVLANSDGGALANAVAAGLRGRAIRLEYLAIVADGLGSTVKVEQAALWARSPQREQAFQLLDPTLRDPLIAWLRGRTGSWGFQQPLPAAISAREIVAILPWLDPWPAIQAGLEAPEEQPWTDILIERILRVVQSSHQAPPPPPPEKVLLARPAWVRALAALPGWEEWRVAAAPASQQIPKEDSEWKTSAK